MADGSHDTLSPRSLLATEPKLRLPSTTDPPSDTNPSSQKTWLIFGATGHIGRSLVKSALGHGDNVAAVGWTMENTAEQMRGWHERCLGLLSDVRVRQTVQACVDACIAEFGCIDVVVNCTGHGIIAACEDQDSCDVRSQFETNFLGTLNIIQLTLPYFREQSAERGEDESAGRYIIFSSTSGAQGVPGLGPYCATKYATEGLVESMLYEIDAFRIKATLVEPAHMRLDEPAALHDPALQGMAQPDHKINLKRYGHFFVKAPSEPYNTPTAPAGHARRIIQWLVDRQPTSAVKSAELVWQLGHCRYPPLRLLLGSYAVESVRDRLRSVIEEIEEWKYLHFPVVEEGGKAKGSKSVEEDEEEDEAGKWDDEDMDLDGEDGETGVEDSKKENGEA